MGRSASISCKYEYILFKQLEVYQFVFKTLTSVPIFNIKSLIFRYLLYKFDLVFHFLAIACNILHFIGVNKKLSLLLL